MMSVMTKVFRVGQEWIKVWTEPLVDSYPVKLGLFMMVLTVFITICLESVLYQVLLTLALTVYHHWRAISLASFMSLSAVGVFLFIMLFDLIFETYMLLFILSAMLLLPASITLDFLSLGWNGTDDGDNEDDVTLEETEEHPQPENGCTAMSGDESDEADDLGTPRSNAGSGWSDATDHLGRSENNSPGRSFSANETELQLSPIKTLHISTSPPTPAPAPRVMSRNALATRKSIARRPKSSDVDGEAKSERELDNGEGGGDGKDEGSGLVDDFDSATFLGSMGSWSSSRTTLRRRIGSGLGLGVSKGLRLEMGLSPVIGANISAAKSPQQLGLAALQELEEADEEAFLSLTANESELRRKRQSIDWSPQIAQSPQVPQSPQVKERDSIW